MVIDLMGLMDLEIENVLKKVEVPMETKEDISVRLMEIDLMDQINQEIENDLKKAEVLMETKEDI